MLYRTRIQLVTEVTDRTRPYAGILTSGISKLGDVLQRSVPDTFDLTVLSYESECIVDGIAAFLKASLSADLSGYDRRLAVFIVGKQEPEILAAKKKFHVEQQSTFMTLRTRSLIISQNPNAVSMAGKFGLDGRNHLYYHTPQELEHQLRVMTEVVDRYCSAAWFLADRSLDLLASELLAFRPDVPEAGNGVVNIDL